MEKKEKKKHDRQGRPGKAVVMLVNEDNQLYFESMRDAATVLMVLKNLDDVTNISVANLISLSCKLQGRKVYGIKFRFATEEEMEHGGLL